jgi:hypothetical protein
MRAAAGRMHLPSARCVVNFGWLEGKLNRKPKPRKPAPTADEITAAKLTNLDARLKRWETNASGLRLH